jgi:hypothetical protein
MTEGNCQCEEYLHAGTMQRSYEIHHFVRNDILCLGADLLFSLIGESFVDQHYGDIVLDRVEQMTGLADQTVPFAIQENISFTSRTGQNLQKFFTDRHLHSPFLYKKKTFGSNG